MEGIVISCWGAVPEIQAVSDQSEIDYPSQWLRAREPQVRTALLRPLSE